MNLTGRPVMQKGVKARRVPAMRNAAREQPCTLRLDCCNRDPSTVVLHHIRMFGWAGIAEKPPDYLAVFACSACHDALHRAGEWGHEDLLRALGETLMAQYNTGNLTMRGDNE
jgi:hypothetical protein